MADEIVVENTTKLGLRADMTIDEEPVAVEGVLGSDFFLQLSRPATLGTPISFAYWLRDKYGVQNLGVMLPEEKYKSATEFKAAFRSYKDGKDPAKRKEFETAITEHVGNQVPPQLVELLKSAFLAEVTITDLMIDIKAADKENGVEGSKKMMFGLSVGFPAPLALIPNVDINKLSILVMNAPKNDFTFPERVALPPSAPLPVEPRKATGHIAFSSLPEANGTITLGKDIWTFVPSAAKDKERQVVIGPSLEATLAQMANQLNRQAAGDTALCAYRANLDERRLEIAYRIDGFAGNGFAIAATENSHGEASGTTLAGGFGEAGPGPESQASGSIVFSELPSEAGKIVLNGVEWGFSGTDPAAGEKKARIGKDPAETVANLAAALKASDDAEIGKCSYLANGKALVITSIKAGTTGNAFTISANAEAKAKASGATLAGG